MAASCKRCHLSVSKAHPVSAKVIRHIDKVLQALTSCCSPPLHALDGLCQKASHLVRLACPCMVRLRQEAVSLHLESLFSCSRLTMPGEDPVNPRLARSNMSSFRHPSVQQLFSAMCCETLHHT